MFVISLLLINQKNINMNVLEYLIEHASKHLFTQAAYARYKGLSRPRVCTLVKEGVLQSFKINGAELVYDDQAEYDELGGIRKINNLKKL